MSAHDYRNFRRLESPCVIYLKHVKTVKISDFEPCENLLSSLSRCQVDYEKGLITAHFRATEQNWRLWKINVYYNQSLKISQSFPKGTTSVPVQHSIEMELNIENLTIMFYDKSLKTFTFQLEFDYFDENGNEQSDEKFLGVYTIELPKYYNHTEWNFNKDQIDFYHPTKEIREFFNSDCEATDESSPVVKTISEDFVGFRKIKKLQTRFETFGYCKMFERMLWLEDLTIQKALDELTTNDITVHPTRSPNLFAVDLEGKKLNENLEFNSLVLTPMSLVTTNRFEHELEVSKIYTQIVTISGTRITFRKSKRSRINKKETYRVQLVANRMQIRLAMKMLEKIESSGLEDFFTTFDSESLANQSQKFLSVFPVTTINCCNPSIRSNKSQQETVKNILNRTSFPAPYVIFGPPGTGKTSTLVEAVAQIVKLQPNAKVLVTANSNTACDEIGERLLKFIPKYKMYRLYSASFDAKFPDRNQRLHKDLKPLSNMRNDKTTWPTYEEFWSYNVVLSTLVNCGRMITVGIPTSHFDYIFVDECASTIEPMSIIPIVGLGTDRGRATAQVVIAGDHKQLQGIVHSYFIEKNGFGISLMERVMMLDRYKHPYDPRYVTQLTDNFRSHWAILKFSNVRFYHSVLRACQRKEVAEFAIGWDMLPNKKFPLLFHSILAPSQMDGTSLYNDEEIRIVASYVKKILDDGINNKKVSAHDIGIICPYGAQRRRLQQKFKFTPDLEIGTVDSFQGREKLIIIMSTVRSQTSTIGFLKNEKRLNVALTRAKALLIVIGNGETLQKNKLWYKFLNYCKSHKALIGERFMLRYRKPQPGTEAGAAGSSTAKKAPPIFQAPKVPIIGSDEEDESIIVISSSEEDPNDWNWLSSDVVSETDSDAISESDSDVSWTHEDFRLKAKTAKLKKKKTIATLKPRVSFRPRVSVAVITIESSSHEGTGSSPDLNNNSTFENLKISTEALERAIARTKAQLEACTYNH